MMYSTLLVLLSLALVASATSYNGWNIIAKAPEEAEITIRFALRQYNLDVIESTLLDVSDPTSPNYGKWWNREQIMDLVAPDASVSRNIAAFLSANGASLVEDMRDSVKCTASVRALEDLLQISLHLFRHKTQDKYIIRSDEECTIPVEIADHVDFVAGLYEYPTPRTQAESIQPIMDGFDAYIAPQTLATLYKIPLNFGVNANSSLCVVEYLNYGGAEDGDLDMFTNGTALSPIAPKHKVGNYTNFCLEGTLDMEYAAALAMNTSLWVWSQNGWLYDFAADVMALEKAPYVISMSWGVPEPQNCGRVHNCTKGETSREYVDRVNTQYQLLGLRGITILASSGDQGAPGDMNTDCSATGSNVFSNIFPGASPWVLSVGATMLVNSTEPGPTTPPICAKYDCASATEEVVCTYPRAIITSGGGFSNYAALPSYQESAVAGYLKNPSNNIPPTKLFNSSNRAFPDVAALGHNFMIAYGNAWTLVDGTSASTPVWAAIISLLNSYRFNNNKPSLGFVNTMLYQAYASDSTMFIDITSGDNKCTEACCDKYGYEAAVGWDPVTGLGSPQFDKLLQYVQNLP